MMVRPIIHEDVEDVVALCEQCYDEMGFDELGYRFDKDHITKGFYDAANGCEHSLCLIAKDNGNIVGLIVFSVTSQTMYFRNRKIATEIVWHSAPYAPPVKRTKIMYELLRTALGILQDKGVKAVFCSSDIRHTIPQRILDRNGFKNLSLYSVKEL